MPIVPVHNVTHSIKLAVSGRVQRDVRSSDHRLSQVDDIIAELQRQFPQLETAINENERMWIALGHNMSIVSHIGQKVYPEADPMQFVLRALRDAGESVMRPPHAEGHHEQRRRSRAELSAFNNALVKLRALHKECLSLLRNKEYYASKVEALRSVENGRHRRASEREAEKHTRNRYKLNYFSAQLSYRTDALLNELDDILNRKERLLHLVMPTYILTQNDYFSSNPILPVMSVMKDRTPFWAEYEWRNCEESAKAKDNSDRSLKCAEQPLPPSVLSCSGKVACMGNLSSETAMHRSPEIAVRDTPPTQGWTSNAYSTPPLPSRYAPQDDVVCSGKPHWAGCRVGRMNVNGTADLTHKSADVEASEVAPSLYPSVDTPERKAVPTLYPTAC